MCKEWKNGVIKETYQQEEKNVDGEIRYLRYKKVQSMR
jgi:hypothetical protein